MADGHFLFFKVLPMLSIFTATAAGRYDDYLRMLDAAVRRARMREISQNYFPAFRLAVVDAGQRLIAGVIITRALAAFAWALSARFD